MTIAVTPKQHEVALAQANRTRLNNLFLLKGIAQLDYTEGRIVVAAILRNPVDTEQSIRVGKLCLSIRLMGVEKLKRLLRTAGVDSRDVRLSRLTERQRFALAAAIDVTAGALTDRRDGGWSRDDRHASKEGVVMGDDKCANGYPVKLVRDHIGESLGGDGTLTYKPADDETTHVALLRRKLIEEAIEYVTDPSVGELADVLEVVWSLAAVDLRAPFEAIEQRAKTKRIERGGFKRGMVMVAHHPADGRDLLRPEPCKHSFAANPGMNDSLIRYCEACGVAER